MLPQLEEVVKVPSLSAETPKKLLRGAGISFYLTQATFWFPATLTGEQWGHSG